MPNLVKPNKKKSKPSLTSGRFTSPEEAGKAKNADLIAHVKKIGLKVVKANSSSK